MGQREERGVMVPDFTVTDLKQHLYCPRIPWFRLVQPVKSASTYAMERGHRVQDRVEALEKRRSFREYGLPTGERLFGLWLKSDRLGLSGRIDMAVRTHVGVFPVDFKDTEGPVRANHRVQLTAYAMLLEEYFDMPSSLAFIYRVPDDLVFTVEVGPVERDDVQRRLEAMRMAVQSEAFPEATSVRARCVECEFVNYCGDVS